MAAEGGGASCGCGDGNGAAPPSPAEPGLRARGRVGKEKSFTHMMPETQVLFFAPASLGLAGSDGISPDRQGPGDDVRWGGALPQVGVRTCSGAALPAEGTKGAGVRRRRKARSLRRSPGHGSGGPHLYEKKQPPGVRGPEGQKPPPTGAAENMRMVGRVSG